MKKIVVAHGHSSLEILHSLTPLILSIYQKKDWKWKFIDYKFFNLNKENGDLLILVRKFHNKKIDNQNMIEELIKLKKNFSKIIYFDDSASPSMIHFCIFPYVDSYWKRSILKNKNLYYNKYYGGRVFSDYYHNNFGINDNKIIFNPLANKETNFEKLKIAWNIGIGIYPLKEIGIFNNFSPIVRRLVSGVSILPSTKFLYKFTDHSWSKMKKNLLNSVDIKKKILKISARFSGSDYTDSIGYQRTLVLNKIKNNNLFLKGKITKKKFINETYRVFGTFSAFGWGEICYRDFEACLGGSLLIKPDMSHLLSWPNIYMNNMYCSLNWDFENMDKIQDFFNSPIKAEEAVNQSREEYHNCLNTAPSRCVKLIEEII